jgi:hypothetical protein
MATDVWNGDLSTEARQCPCGRIFATFIVGTRQQCYQCELVLYAGKVNSAGCLNTAAQTTADK